jgi:[ribosomal protein S5]-alanine N-acetyltransferase
MMIIETSRLWLREMEQSDYPELCKILQDEDVMYAYEGGFSDAEVQAWLDKDINNYKELGFGRWAVILKGTNEMIGQCGLTIQNFNDKQVLEVSYLFQKSFWGHGYATEAAIACRDYAFEKLNASEVFSIIRDTNIASQNVAKRNGMTIVDKFIKHYRGIDMLHFLFSVKRSK